MTLTLSANLVPDQPGLTLTESSYFREHQTLPSIDEVRQQQKQYVGPKDGIAMFPNLGLLVKFGPKVQIAEGQCLIAIRCRFGDRVPVPELYAWRTDGNVVFIFMQLVSGTTLEVRWDQLDAEERNHVCQQLRSMLEILRSARQAESEHFIGQLKGIALNDVALPPEVVAGPFNSVADFNTWFSMLYRRNLANPEAFPADPYRQYLPDDVSIKFTHGDLHPSNIMVSSTGIPHIISIIDWQQAGWLPEYWEVRKAIYTAKVGGEWAERFIPLFLDRWEDTWAAWDFYVSANGN